MNDKELVPFLQQHNKFLCATCQHNVCYFSLVNVVICDAGVWVYWRPFL